MGELCSCFFCFLIVAACTKITEGFEWKSPEFVYVTGCVGSKVTLPWAYVTQPGESIDNIFWTQGVEHTIASLYQDRFISKGASSERVKRSLQLNAAIDIDTVELTDTGYYGVQISMQAKDHQGNEVKQEFKAAALLTVGEAPSISGDALDVQEMTSDDTCAAKRQVTLSCGHFISRGFPPVDVVWTDPVGQLLTSSRFSGGKFHLDLPRRPLPGNYTCRLTCQSPVLHCLPHNSPLLGNHQVHVQALDSADCAASLDPSEGEASAPERKERDFAQLVENITLLQQSVATLQESYADFSEEKNRTAQYGDLEKQRETFEFQVQELRKSVALQEARDAKVELLREVMDSLERTVSEVHQNVSTLLQERDERDEQLQSLKQMVYAMENRHSLELDELKMKIDANEQTAKRNEKRLSQTEVGLASLRIKHKSPEASLTQAGKIRDQDFSKIWMRMYRIEELCNDTVDVLRGVLAGDIQDTQRSSQQIHNEVTATVNGISARVGDVEQEFSQLAEQVKTQCNATDVELWPLEERLDKVEEKLALSQRNHKWRLARDPLVSTLQPTFSLTPPQDRFGMPGSILHDFVITQHGQVIMADYNQNSVTIARNASDSDFMTQPLKYGARIRALTNMQDGIIAATVNDNYIYILNTTTTSVSAQLRERWVRTQMTYYGVAARSRQTLFVGVGSGDGDGVARIDVIAINNANSEVLTTLLDQTTTKELQNPKGMTVHDEHLYISDWDSNHVLRVSLDTRRVTLIAELSAQPQLRFFQPRQTAFDVNGNMYVTTGGEVCGKVQHQYSRGFCVVVVSREGSWKRLITNGRDVFPYGLALTPTGLAVSLVSWVHAPVRSLIQWYDLVQPQG